MIVLVWLAAWDKSLVYFSFCYSNHATKLPFLKRFTSILFALENEIEKKRRLVNNLSFK